MFGWIKKQAKSIIKIAKPLEKIVGPIIKNTIDSVPVFGPIITGTHDTLKRNVWDVIRRTEGGTDDLVRSIQSGLGNTIGAAAAGAKAGVAVQQTGLSVSNSITNNPGLVLGGIGLAMLAFGFGRKR